MKKNHTTKMLASLVLTAALMAGIGFPATVSATTHKSNTTVTNVLVNPSSEILIKLASGVSGEGCNKNDWAKIKTSTPYYRELFNLVLSAFLSGRKITVKLQGCSYYPVVVRAELKN